MSKSRKTTGLILGSFMPVHDGHEYLINFARHFVDQLTVVILNVASDPIPVELRVQWLKELFSNVQIITLSVNSSEQKSDHSQQSSAWINSLLSTLPQLPHYVFGSHNNGWHLSKMLGARFIPVDPKHTNVQITAQAIRSDPLANWDFLPECVRPYFVRRVCIFGPESTGKSTLAANLASHFNTVAVPEWARIHIEARDNKLDADDIAVFAKGQIASEDAMARRANRVLFCDTDAIITSIWSDWLFGACPESVKELANIRKYDLYLLTDVDVPWVDDPQRYLPNDRQAFFDRCINELQSRKRTYVIVRGNWYERFQSAVTAVEQLLNKPAVIGRSGA